MEKSTKIAIAVASVLAVGGVIYWFVTKRKQVKEDGQVGLFGKKGTSFQMGYLNRGVIHLYGDDRKKANPFLSVGTKVTIKDTDFDGDYTISYIWKDANGNVGGFKTKEKSIENNIDQDRSFEKIGKIIVEEVKEN